MSKLNDPRYFLLNTVPDLKDKEILGSKLPTVKQILLCFIAHHSESTSKREAASKVISGIAFYIIFYSIF